MSVAALHIDSGAREACVAQEALTQLQNVRVGMHRLDIERSFTQDGGMAFRDRTVYVFKKCPYIKVEVVFASDPAVEGRFSPNDEVVSISKLFIDYPAKD
jgi:hypothetical protein